MDIISIKHHGYSQVYLIVDTAYVI